MISLQIWFVNTPLIVSIYFYQPKLSKVYVCLGDDKLWLSWSHNLWLNSIKYTFDFNIKLNQILFWKTSKLCL